MLLITTMLINRGNVDKYPIFASQLKNESCFLCFMQA